MIIECIHGYFIFKESSPGDAWKFSNRFGLILVPSGDGYFTFEPLAAAPHYSLQGSTYLGADSPVTSEGMPWEVMEANGLVFNFATLVPITSVTTRVKIQNAGRYFVSSGLIVPGSVTDDGQRVRDYSAHYSTTDLTFKYSQVTYV